jgi:hypothetical protein
MDHPVVSKDYTDGNLTLWLVLLQISFSLPLWFYSICIQLAAPPLRIASQSVPAVLSRDALVTTGIALVAQSPIMEVSGQKKGGGIGVATRCRPAGFKARLRSRILLEV